MTRIFLFVLFGSICNLASAQSYVKKIENFNGAKSVLVGHYKQSLKVAESKAPTTELGWEEKKAEMAFFKQQITAMESIPFDYADAKKAEAKSAKDDDDLSTTELLKPFEKANFEVESFKDLPVPITRMIGTGVISTLEVTDELAGVLTKLAGCININSGKGGDKALDELDKCLDDLDPTNTSWTDPRFKGIFQNENSVIK